MDVFRAEGKLFQESFPFLQPKVGVIAPPGPGVPEGKGDGVEDRDRGIPKG